MKLGGAPRKPSREVSFPFRVEIRFGWGASVLSDPPRRGHGRTFAAGERCDAIPGSRYDGRMEFPVSGVEVNPLVPLLAAFLVSVLTAPAGVSGAFLLLPFQVSVLGFASPAVSPTNLIYNVIATPGGVYRYAREGRVVWPLAGIILAGSLPGVFLGAVLRTTIFADPEVFKIFIGLVLLYLGVRLLLEVWKGGGGSLSGSERVRGSGFSRRMGWYEFGGRRFSYSFPAVFALSFMVGMVGGIYSIGGGAIIAPFLVSMFGLPVFTVAGAALVGTFITSVAGVAFFEILSASPIGENAASPDWLLGATLGAGGLAGTYAGARLQKFLPERGIKAVLGGLVTVLAAGYLLGIF